jgi:hypothetical protein
MPFPKLKLFVTKKKKLEHVQYPSLYQRAFVTIL